MKTGVGFVVIAVLIFLLVFITMVINGRIGGGLTRILSTSDDQVYCEETKTTIKEYTSILEAKISNGEDAKNYYEFHANEGCFQDPKDVDIAKQQKCNLFCKEGSFNVEERTQKAITRFCRNCE